MKQHMLLTGGAGYIGAHCCSALSDAGFLPYATTISRLAMSILSNGGPS
jgi:UDP-glucose 4-epimerase